MAAEAGYDELADFFTRSEFSANANLILACGRWPVQRAYSSVLDSAIVEYPNTLIYVKHDLWTL